MLPVTSSAVPCHENSKGCSWGRAFTTVLSQVAKIGLLTLGIIPAAAANLIQTARYMNPGQMLTRSGTASCGTNQIFFTDAACFNFATTLLTEYLPPSKNALRFTELELQSRHEKGIARDIKVGEQNPTSFRFFIPQERFLNYEKALRYAKWAFLDDPRIYYEGTKKIESVIKKLHSILVAHEDTPTGLYRTTPKIINPDHHFDDARLEWENKNLSPEELITLERTNYALQKKEHFHQLTQEELTTWKKVVHIPTSECLIEPEMNSFLTEFAGRMIRGGDYIDHAGFFHKELTRISPFLRGVGRLARLMTNIILLTGEHSPVVFADHREYTQAVRSSDFTKYLRKELDSTKSLLPHLDDPMKRQIIDAACSMNPGKPLVNVGRQFLAQGCPIPIDQQRYYNYQNALYFVQQHTLSELSKEQLVELFKETQILLAQNLEQDEPYILGQYRTGYMIVDGVGDPERLIARIQELFYGQQLQDFIASYNAVLKDVTHLGRLTAHEKTLWNEIAHIPCPPDQIKNEVELFCQTLSERLKAPTIDYLDLASFVHMQFARIWAYPDANGRLARLFMNEILRLGRKPPITFPNEQQYLKTVHAAMADSSLFTRYLRSIAR